MTASTPVCICGPLCENRGHCRIPAHHRLGCPVSLDPSRPADQYDDHRELLTEKPNYDRGECCPRWSKEPQYHNSLCWVNQNWRRRNGEMALPIEPTVEDERGELIAALDDAERIIGRSPIKVRPCSHDECAGNDRCHRRCNWESVDEPGRWCKLTLGHLGSHSEYPQGSSSEPRLPCYREWFHRTHGGGWGWACPSNAEWIRDLESGAQAFNAENRGRAVNITHVAKDDCPACKSARGLL